MVDRPDMTNAMSPASAVLHSRPPTSNSQPSTMGRGQRPVTEATESLRSQTATVHGVPVFRSEGVIPLTNLDHNQLPLNQLHPKSLGYSSHAYGAQFAMAFAVLQQRASTQWDIHG